jgi:cyclophilin family peptidyl-prolyl cis-trans isomerase
MKILSFFIIIFSLQALADSPRLSEEAIIFRTDYGDMVVALYPDHAPLHTKQILKLASAGVYTKTLIFRTDKGYVAQIENFNARAVPLDAEQLKLIEKIPAEFNSIPHRRGILSMARYDDPNSAESSFSFVLGNAPNLDGQYTVFGEVIQNIEVLDEIEKLPPKTVYINSAEVVFKKDLAQYTIKPAGAPSTNYGYSSTVQIFIFTIISLSLLLVFGMFSKK